MRMRISTAFFWFLVAVSGALPALGEQSQIIVEADGSKHWNNTYGNGYAAARILDRVAETKRQAYDSARSSLQLEAQALLRDLHEEEKRYRAMRAKEQAEYDGLRREYLRLEAKVMENGRNRIERAETETFTLKVSDRVQVKKSNGKYIGIRGIITKIEAGTATVDLECGLSRKIPVNQLINLMALPLNKDDRAMVNQYHDAKDQFWNYSRERLENIPK